MAADPNVLVVVLDTVRKDHLTPYGYDRPTTPALASFADEARVYEEAVSQAPWTLPAHASLFTGQYPSVHGATQESPYLSAETATLAEAVSASGYTTTCFSSNAWITPYTRLTAGFDEQDSFFEALPGSVLATAAADLWSWVLDSRLRPLADRLVAAGNAVHERLAARGRAASRTPAIVDRTQQFIEGADGPWFAFLNLMDAHLPYYPPEQYRQQFAPDVDPGAVCQNSKAYNAGAREVDEAEFEAIRRLYDAELRHLDAELGRLFEFLRTSGRWDDTAVVVCADHGELHGEFGRYGHEFAVYEPLVNVPLLVDAPGIEPGRDRQQVELLDLYDTVLDIAGAAEAASSVGARPFEPERSLCRPGRDIEDGDYGFIEYDRPVVELEQLERKAAAAGIELDEDGRFYSRMRAARRPDGKYIRNERLSDEGYRLDSDSGESTEAAADDPIIEATEAALCRFEDRVAVGWDGHTQGDGGDPLGRMDETAKSRLRDLGYLE
ncbi:AlkP-core domain protein [Natronomonas pharaonis DSM 2160]|uniref:AlkP-core domain protein n=1 Tax=Natronomonas pharaonis (strain ATCC 35678 / DSM 2160 / CIP 103997 / JCM 8858 / NBRC 14720 / NCIMB 2260 / Gabara) TaxID=348780 RepID=A0A1U7EUD2_NATPD|nr:sulfatase [Natronomonas pharaonis]CAI48564.1 AlkP-core domain protein [Natronomonas pharaonis DSM 2160]